MKREEPKNVVVRLFKPQQKIVSFSGVKTALIQEMKNPNEAPAISGNKSDTVQISIEIEKLESLFNQGELCANDFRCLNCESKKCIWNLCLKSCAKRIECNLECLGKV